MKRLKCKHVSTLESGDEYFQVCFETKFDSIVDYLLIQRGFEGEEIEGSHYYIESDDESFIGHNILKEATLSRNKFYIKSGGSQKSEFEVLFNISDKNFKEIQDILEIIFTGFNLLKIDLA